MVQELAITIAGVAGVIAGSRIGPMLTRAYFWCLFPGLLAAASAALVGSRMAGLSGLVGLAAVDCLLVTACMAFFYAESSFRRWRLRRQG